MPGGPPAVTVFQEVPPSPEELARQAGEQEPEPEPEAEPGPPAPEPDRMSSASQAVVAPEGATDAEPVATTDAVRHEFDGGRLIAIEIEEGGGVTRIVRGDDGWSVHPG
jgi:hypothetical protein